MKRKHIQALRWAVVEAAAWRGESAGVPDEPALIESLIEFDRRVALAKEALKEVRKLYKAHKK